ncbi:MAG: hypothetical protein ACJ76D_06980 [Solirubrobacterales bacterium]
MAPATDASAAEEAEKYAIESASASLASNQAGAHADLTIGFALTEESGQPYAQTRNLEFKLPPGMIGNPQVVHPCTIEDFGNIAKESHCPPSSQVGIAKVKVGGVLNKTLFQPLYNIVPPENGDAVARLGFFATGQAPTFANVSIDPIDYSVVTTVEGIPSLAFLVSTVTTLWAVPADPVHDLERLTPKEAEEGKVLVEPRSVEVAEKAFLTNPTNCDPAGMLRITATSYELPGAPSSKDASFPQMGGCTKLAFEPVFTAVPTNPEAFAPTGLNTELRMPQNEVPNGRATSTLRSAKVSLPPGFTVNPAAGDGQQACSSEQVHVGKALGAACPDASKVGSIEADVPALARPLRGSVYLRTPEPGHLFRLWLVADEQGVHLKLPAEIELNPVTGQISTVVSGLSSLGGLPQVPVADLKLNVFGGPRAPVATPGCGTYQTSFRFAPWSGTPAVEGQTPMQITSGCNKGGFSPSLLAGTLNTGAGEFSPFTMTLSRSDGEGNPQTLALHLPQGLLAKLGGVPLCPDSAAASGACPAGSRIGGLAASAGVGGAPLWIPQPGKAPTAIYLAGPYKGAPYSVVAVVPAQAGPFDLGTVVNRSAIFVDPETALATIKTDPLPQILEGVPVSYRTLHVDVDRKDFTLNPTDCSRKKIRAIVTAADGRGDEPTSPFQATNCAKLAYKPKLKLSFRGSTKRTGHPALEAVLTQKHHQANTSSATVILPASEFIDQAHISNPCTRVQFNAEACPKGSVLGTAKAITPLFDRPLKGKVYFRSNGGERELPDIVADLRGPIHVTLVGFIDSVHRKGSESSRVRTRFVNVPDAPVSRFTMSLYGGQRGLLVNSHNLCERKRRVSLDFEAQNGRVKHATPVIATSCR